MNQTMLDFTKVKKREPAHSVNATTKGFNIDLILISIVLGVVPFTVLNKFLLFTLFCYSVCIANMSYKLHSHVQALKT